MSAVPVLTGAREPKRSDSSFISVLAWFDSLARSPVSVVAFHGTRPIRPKAAYNRLFDDGMAGAARCLPWLRERPDVRAGPLCAYGAIVGGQARGVARVYSGSAICPTDRDRARLKLEFQAFLREELRSPPRVAVELFATPNERSGNAAISILSGEVTIGGVGVSIPDGEFGVLVGLALNARPVIGRAFAVELWPEREPEDAANLLKVYMHRIRTRLGSPDIVRSTNRGYELGPGVTVDLPDLERRVRAARANLAVSEVDAVLFRHGYSAFATRAYRRLSEFEYFSLIEGRIELLGGDLAMLLARFAWNGQDPQRALDVAEELLVTDPACEAAVELAIRAYAATGDRDAALSRYRVYCTRLQRELDAAPSARLAALVANMGSA
jgi:DNA-binding SARP family transcriptional activator